MFEVAKLTLEDTRLLNSKFCIKAPPPANMIPFSIISDASSGGDFSSVVFTTSTIFDIDYRIASSI